MPHLCTTVHPLTLLTSTAWTRFRWQEKQSVRSGDENGALCSRTSPSLAPVTMTCVGTGQRRPPRAWGVRGMHTQELGGVGSRDCGCVDRSFFLSESRTLSTATGGGRERGGRHEAWPNRSFLGSCDGTRSTAGMSDDRHDTLLYSKECCSDRKKLHDNC